MPSVAVARLSKKSAKLRRGMEPTEQSTETKENLRCRTSETSRRMQQLCRPQLQRASVAHNPYKLGPGLILELELYEVARLRH